MAGKTTYKPEYDNQAYKVCSQFGATDKELAKFFDVTKTTVENWKLKHPSFFDSIKDGRDDHDTTKVRNALLQRALGYEHEDTYFTSYQGVIVSEKYTKHYAPDVTACIFWLVNRSDKWQHINRERSTSTEDFNDILKTIASASRGVDTGELKIPE